MRSFTFAAFILSISFTPVAQSTLSTVTESVGKVCLSVPNQDDRVKGRSSHIQFPDGRVITVVGHFHGTRQIYKLYNLIEFGQFEKLSNSDFESLFLNIRKENSEPLSGQFLNSSRVKMVSTIKKKTGADVSDIINTKDGFDLQNPTVLNQANQDYLYLKNLLGIQASNRIKFVGWEGSEQTLNYNKVGFQNVNQKIILDFFNRKKNGGLKMSYSELREILLSATNANVFTYIKNSDLASQIPIVGTEDQSTGLDYENADPLFRLDEAFSQIDLENEKYLASRPKAQQDNFFKNAENIRFLIRLLVLKTEVENVTIFSLADFENKVVQLHSGNYPWLKDALETFFEASKVRLTLNWRRDSASAKNLTDRHQSGVHFVGLNHYKDTMRFLEKLCIDEMK